MDREYYIYIYLDPRKKGIFKYAGVEFDYEPFCVGKGKKDRYKSHLKEKEKKKNIIKANKINKIIKNNAKYWLGKHHSEETKEKLREKRKYQDMSYRCKTYKAVSPNNQVFIIKNGLEKFCKLFNLQRSKMVMVAQGKRNHHKKWKCSYIGDDL